LALGLLFRLATEYQTLLLTVLVVRELHWACIKRDAWDVCMAQA
jgi:hypothetical protein